MDEEVTGQGTDFDDIVEAFMNEEVDEETLSAGEEGEDDAEGDEPEVEQEEVEDEGSEGDDADPDDADEGDDDKPAAKVAEDDAEVAITVEGKEHRVSVKDLKRLFGQEAALTQKAQAIAAQRRTLDDHGLYMAKILQTRYDAAKQKVAKYADVDLFKASRELDPEDFDALRAAKEGAESELKALEVEGQEFVHRARQTRVEHLRAQAKETLKVITKAIPEWNDELYGKVTAYAVSQGMDPDTANEIVDASAILMMHKAMKYDQSQAKKATVQKKIVKTPAKVLKTSDAPADRASAKLKSIKAKASASGDVDDVTALFLAATAN
jgi:hypothetical protein